MGKDKCLIDPERDCFGLQKAKEIEQDVNDLRRQNNATHERIFDKLNEMEKNESIQAVKRIGYESQIEEIKKDIKDQKEKPAKRWESMTEKIIGLVIAAVVGYILAHIGLG